MSVLVKGMEMPTSCSVCPMLEGDRIDGLCHAASKWLDDDEHWKWYVYPEGDIDDSKPCNCPLIPVPAHGKLIDADAVAKMVLSSVNQEDARGFMFTKIICQILKEAPTIIPAEPCKEKGE